MEKQVRSVPMDKMVRFQNQLWFVHSVCMMSGSTTLRKMQLKRHFKAVPWRTVVEVVGR